jgi:hypothetical protein
MFIRLHVKYLLFLSDFNQPVFSQQVFDESTNIKFNDNQSSGSRFVPCEETDGQTDMMKLIVAFHSLENAPKKRTNVSWRRNRMDGWLTPREPTAHKSLIFSLAAIGFQTRVPATRDIQDYVRTGSQGHGARFSDTVNLKTFSLAFT